MTLDNVPEYSLISDIKEILHTARNTVYKTANSAMVQAYWQIGKLIVEKQGGEAKANYGDSLISNLSKELTIEFGKGFTSTNLKNMRTFYLTFPKGQTLSDLLTWSHYCLLIRIENPKARRYYEEETAKCNWSVRQLQR